MPSRAINCACAQNRYAHVGIVVEISHERPFYNRFIIHTDRFFEMKSRTNAKDFHGKNKRAVM